jgi:hypothetical protein
MKGKPKLQRGVGTLAVAIVLLIASSIAVLYLNRAILFEQKASADQLRSTAAFEAAEAGLEWATAMLNQPFDISTSCVFNTSTNLSFRRKYVQTTFATSPNVAANTTTFPGCTMDPTNAGALNCSCPASGAAALSPTSPVPGFTVAFANVAGDAESVEVTSVGCAALAGLPCTAANAASADATARVRVILKLSPLLRAAPAAALTCGTTCALSGSFNVANFDPSTNGITINAGTTTTGTAGSIGSLPGLPPANSVVGADSSLATLAAADPTCTQSKLFAAYFGSTVPEYIAAPATKTISCTSANDCGTKVETAYLAGWRSFYFPAATGLALNSSSFTSAMPTFGTLADPVTIVTDGSVNINASMTIYGIIFSNNSTLGDLGTGSSTVRGALVTCAGFTSNGNGSIVYDRDALRNVQLSTASVARVPGSWRDFF